MTAWCIVGAVALTGGAVTGCDDACGTNCGGGVNVWWKPDDIPDAATYRLCVNGTCEPVIPVRSGGERQYRTVSAASCTAERDVVVRFEALNPAGTPVATLEGEGRKEGDCCPSVHFRPERGALVVAKP